MRNNSSRNSGNRMYEDYTEFSSKVESPIRFGARDQRAYTSFALEQEVEARPIVKATPNGNAPMPNNGYPIVDINSYSFDDTQAESQPNEAMGEYVSSEYAEEYLDTDGTSISQIEHDPNTFESLPSFSRRNVFNNYGSVPSDETPEYLSADDGGIVSHEVGDEDAEVEHGHIVMPTFANHRISNMMRSVETGTAQIDSHLGAILEPSSDIKLSPVSTSTTTNTSNKITSLSEKVATTTKKSPTLTTTNRIADLSEAEKEQLRQKLIAEKEAQSTNLSLSTRSSRLSPSLTNQVSLAEKLTKLDLSDLNKFFAKSKSILSIPTLPAEEDFINVENKSTDDFLPKEGEASPLTISFITALFNAYNENFSNAFGSTISASNSLISELNKLQNISTESSNELAVNIVAFLIVFNEVIPNLLKETAKELGVSERDILEQAPEIEKLLEIANQNISVLSPLENSGNILEIARKLPDLIRETYVLFIGADNAKNLPLVTLDPSVKLVDPNDVVTFEDEVVDLGNGLLLETATNFILNENNEVVGRLVNEEEIQLLAPITVDDEIYFLHVSQEGEPFFDEGGNIYLYDQDNQLADRETIDAVRQELLENIAEEGGILDNIEGGALAQPRETPLQDFSTTDTDKSGLPSWVLPVSLLGLAGGAFFFYHRSQKNKR